jgi:hypothetical protein
MSVSVHVSPHISVPHISPHISPHVSPHISEPHIAPHVTEPSAPHTFIEPTRPSSPPMWFWFVHPHNNNGTTSTVCDDGSDYCHHYAPNGLTTMGFGVVFAILIGGFIAMVTR